MVSDNTSQQDQRSSQAPPTKKSNVYSDDAVESTLSRPPTLHKQPPALPPKPFTRIPNHITGDLSIFRWSSDPSTERVWFLAFLVQMGLRSGCHVCQWSCRLLYLQRSSWSPYLQAAWSPHRLTSRGALLPPATSRWEVIHCSTGRFRFTHQVESLRSSTKHWRSPCRGLRGKNLHISLPPLPPAAVPSTPTSTHTQLQLQNYCLWESGWCWNCWIASWRKGSAWIMKCKVWKTIVVFADRCPPTLAEISLLLQLPTPHSSLWLVACLKVHFPGCRCRPHSCCHCRSQSRTSTCFYSLFFFPQPWPSECQNVYTPSVHHITAHI